MSCLAPRTAAGCAPIAVYGDPTLSCIAILLYRHTVARRALAETSACKARWGPLRKSGSRAPPPGSESPVSQRLAGGAVGDVGGTFTDKLTSAAGDYSADAGEPLCRWAMRNDPLPRCP